MLSIEELHAIGFGSVGKNVQVSECARFYNPSNIFLGSNTRIDDFCVLSAGEGGIYVGDYVHVAVYASLIGTGKITLSNFANISGRVSIYSSNDDYSGAFLTNPTVPGSYKNVASGDVFVGKHAIVGSGSVILPKLRIGDGVAIGALSLVTQDCEEFCIYAGAPARKIKERKRDLLQLELKFLQERSTSTK